MVRLGTRPMAPDLHAAMIAISARPLLLEDSCSWTSTGRVRGVPYDGPPLP